MKEKVEIKKELSEIAFKEILAVFQESIKEEENIYELGKYFQEFVKKITPAKEVHLIIVTESSKTLETVTFEKNITIDISSGRGVLAKCYQNKEALFSNDIVRDTYYNEKIDNFLDYSIKNLLVVPLFDKAKDKNVWGIIWAAIPYKDWNKYMQSDIDYMMQVSQLNKKMITKKDAQKEKIQVIEKQFTEKGTSSMVKRLKSWLFR
jgi:hypothetical protein